MVLDQLDEILTSPRKLAVIHQKIPYYARDPGIECSRGQTVDAEALGINLAIEMGGACLYLLLLDRQFGQSQVEFADALGRKGGVVVGLANEYACTGRDEFRLEVIDALLCTLQVLLRDIEYRLSSIKVRHCLYAASTQLIRALEVSRCLAQACGRSILRGPRLGDPRFNLADSTPLVINRLRVESSSCLRQGCPLLGDTLELELLVVAIALEVQESSRVESLIRDICYEFPKVDSRSDTSDGECYPAFDGRTNDIKSRVNSSVCRCARKMLADKDVQTAGQKKQADDDTRKPHLGRPTALQVSGSGNLAADLWRRMVMDGGRNGTQLDVEFEM
jgi:hypothetical protein